MSRKVGSVPPGPEETPVAAVGPCGGTPQGVTALQHENPLDTNG
jgi:hypothetical protein